jgi:hypothetical protein
MTTATPPPGHAGSARESGAVLAQHLQEQIGLLRSDVRRIDGEPVRGPRGEYLSVAEAKAKHDFLRAKIDAAEAGGSLRHRTVAPSLKWVTLLVVGLIDLPIMLWLVSSVFNVDWSHPWGVRLAISIAVSVLATAVVAAILYHLGHIYRQDKNDRRELDWHSISAAGKAVLAVAGALIFLVALGMFVRVFTEGELSGFNGLAVLVAILVAVVMLLSAGLIFFTSFRDGSADQEDLAHLGGVIHKAESRRGMLERQIEQHQTHHAILAAKNTERQDGVLEVPLVSGNSHPPILPSQRRT